MNCYGRFSQRKETILLMVCLVWNLSILVPRAYDPSGLRQESRGSESNHFRNAPQMKTSLNRMGRIRLYPLLFQNGCSQSSRFLPQARRIVGSGDENGIYRIYTPFRSLVSCIAVIGQTFSVLRGWRQPFREGGACVKLLFLAFVLLGFWIVSGCFFAPRSVFTARLLGRAIVL